MSVEKNIEKIKGYNVSELEFVCKATELQREKATEGLLSRFEQISQVVDLHKFNPIKVEFKNVKHQGANYYKSTKTIEVRLETLRYFSHEYFHHVLHEIGDKKIKSPNMDLLVKNLKDSYTLKKFKETHPNESSFKTYYLSKSEILCRFFQAYVEHFVIGEKPRDFKAREVEKNKEVFLQMLVDMQPIK